MVSKYKKIRFCIDPNRAAPERESGTRETGLGVRFPVLSHGPVLGLQILDIYGTDFLTSKIGIHSCLPNMATARIKREHTAL